MKTKLKAFYLIHKIFGQLSKFHYENTRYSRHKTADKSSHGRLNNKHETE